MKSNWNCIIQFCSTRKEEEDDIEIDEFGDVVPPHLRKNAGKKRQNGGKKRQQSYDVQAKQQKMLQFSNGKKIKSAILEDDDNETLKTNNEDLDGWNTDFWTISQNWAKLLKMAGLFVLT